MRCLIKLSVLLCSLAVMGGCASGRTAFDKGQKLETTGDVDQAVLKYAEAAAANPEIIEYRLRLLKAGAEAARLHLVKADGFFAENKYDDAMREYQTAIALDPSLERARQQADAVRKLRSSEIFLKEGEEFEKNRNSREALRSYQKSLEFNPANTVAKEGVERLLKNKRPMLDGFELQLKSKKPITLKFKDAKLKDVFNILTQLSGINFIFDEGVKDQNFSIYLENATFHQALEVITQLNKLGKKILNEKTVIIYPKNAEKNKQYEDLFLQTFYLNKIDAKKAINLLRTMMQIKKIYVNEDLNAIVIRDTPDVIELAGKILEANDISDAEVLLEVEVIELSKRNEENLGFVLSRYAVSTAGFNNGTPFSDVLSGSTTTPDASNLLQIFAWREFSGFLTIPNATFNFAKTLSNGETLANPKIRVKNREKSKFNVGTRVPITTTSSPTGGGVNVNVQYVDVGVKLNAEPTIQLNNEISIKLSMEVSSILSRDTVGGTSSGTTVVTIGTRNMDTVLTLKEGETSIIGGLIQDSKSKSKQKVALLGDIPIIGSLFSGNVNSNDKTELVLAITPRIIRGVAVPDPSVAAFWTGKEDEPSAEKLFSTFSEDLETVQPMPEAPAAVPANGAPVPPRPPASVPPPPKVAAPESALPPAPPVPSTQAPPQAPAAPQLPGRVVLNLSAPSEVKVNEEFRVEVTVTDAKELFSAPFTLQYDTAILEFVGAVEGTFLKKDGKPTAFQANVNRENGQVGITLGRMGEVGGVSGAGTLAVITFRAKAAGPTDIGFGAVDFTSPGNKPMDADLYGKLIEVR